VIIGWGYPEALHRRLTLVPEGTSVTLKELKLSILGGKHIVFGEE